MLPLLPVLQEAIPSLSGFEIVGTVTQANAEGYRVDCQYDGNAETTDDTESDKKPQQLFVKQVEAAHYVNTKKSWPDLRRTLMYLRTEVRFYQEAVPELARRGFAGAIPHVYAANYNLDGLVEENDLATDQKCSEPDPAWWVAKKQGTSTEDDVSKATNGRGGSVVLECIQDSEYFQLSPISLDQAKQTLGAIASLHAAAWQDTELLDLAEKRLSRGSYHLKTRNVKELKEMQHSWESFSQAFESHDLALFQRAKDFGQRIQAVAEYVSEKVSPGSRDDYATLVHGDFKSMNCFLPKSTLNDDCPARSSRGVVMVDFASTGVGLGMSDVAMHIHHAIAAKELANGGEEMLVDHYIETLNRLLAKGGSRTHYPREIALAHYRLACVDYCRFFLGRFWKTATPDTMSKKKDSQNTALINRDLDAAMAFLDRVERYLREVEANV